MGEHLFSHKPFSKWDCRLASTLALISSVFTYPFLEKYPVNPCAAEFIWVSDLLVIVRERFPVILELIDCGINFEATLVELPCSIIRLDSGEPPPPKMFLEDVGAPSGTTDIGVVDDPLYRLVILEAIAAGC